MTSCTLPHCDQPAPGAHACADHREEIRRRLRDIEQYAAHIRAHPERLKGDTSRGSPGYHSTPPGRLDVIVAFDDRSLGASEDRPDDRDDDTMPILATLRGMADGIRYLQQVSIPRQATIPSETVFLLGAVEWVARYSVRDAEGEEHPIIDEFAEEIRRLHDQCRRLAKDAPQRALAPCLVITCGAPVYWTKDVTDPHTGEVMDAARCSGCGRLYCKVDLARLRTQEAW